MDLKTGVQNDLMEAMRRRDSPRVSTLRLLISEIKKREINKRGALDDSEIRSAISSLIRQSHESIEAFRKGGRQDLVDKETQEVEILKGYLPAPLTPEELEKIVLAAIAETGAQSPSDIGKVMKAALNKTAGRADGKTVNEIARAKLSPH